MEDPKTLPRSTTDYELARRLAEAEATPGPAPILSRRHPSGLNRSARRHLAKAARCLDRQTKVPAGVRQTLATIAPGVLVRLADKLGMRIGGDGSVTPKPRPAGDGSAGAAAPDPVGETPTMSEALAA